MPDYANTYSNASLVCERQDNALSFSLLNEQVTYEALDTIAACARASRDDPAVRAFVLHLSAQSSDADAMGAVPARFAHRAPSGSHGPGPIVEQDAIRALREFMKPTIAFLRDEVCDSAIDLACTCDLRIAHENLTLQDTRILQGRTASAGISYVLPKLIGQSQAMRILLLGDEISAEEARRIHLVHEVVADSEYDDYALEFTQRIARMATRAWEVHKLQVLGQQHLDYESAMIHSLGIRQTHVIKDRVEGMKAWRERRDPEFSGT